MSPSAAPVQAPRLTQGPSHPLRHPDFMELLGEPSQEGQDPNLDSAEKGWARRREQARQRHFQGA